MPLIALPAPWLLGIYSLGALIPAGLLMRFIYATDKIEKEPMSLLSSLAFQGVLAAFLAMLLETAGQFLLRLFVPAGSVLYLLILAFVVVALSEEWAKYVFLKRRSWNEPNFNYRFDGVVYAVFVSLGFAAFENLKYVFTYGCSVILPRAVLAIPAHMAFGVFMGAFYGRARQCADRNQHGRACFNRIAAVVSAALLHGFYDACVMGSSTASTVVFCLFVAVMYVVVICKIKQESAADVPLLGWEK